MARTKEVAKKSEREYRIQALQQICKIRESANRLKKQNIRTRGKKQPVKLVIDKKLPVTQGVQKIQPVRNCTQKKQPVAKDVQNETTRHFQMSSRKKLLETGISGVQTIGNDSGKDRLEPSTHESVKKLVPVRSGVKFSSEELKNKLIFKVGSGVLPKLTEATKQDFMAKVRAIIKDNSKSKRIGSFIVVNDVPKVASNNSKIGDTLQKSAELMKGSSTSTSPQSVIRVRQDLSPLYTSTAQCPPLSIKPTKHAFCSEPSTSRDITTPTVPCTNVPIAPNSNVNPSAITLPVKIYPLNHNRNMISKGVQTNRWEIHNDINGKFCYPSPLQSELIGKREEIWRLRRFIKVQENKLYKMYQKNNELQRQLKACMKNNFTRGMLKIQNAAKARNKEAMILLGLIQNFGKKSPRSTNDTVSECAILLNKYQTHCYEAVRRKGVLNLPRKRTLQRHQSINQSSDDEGVDRHTDDVSNDYSNDIINQHAVDVINDVATSGIQSQRGDDISNQDADNIILQHAVDVINDVATSGIQSQRGDDISNQDADNIILQHALDVINDMAMSGIESHFMDVNHVERASVNKDISDEDTNDVVYVNIDNISNEVINDVMYVDISDMVHEDIVTTEQDDIYNTYHEDINNM